MSDHKHAFNATVITTRRNPVLRCACGAWTTKGKLARGEGPVSERVARGLETRLRNEGAVPVEPSARPTGSHLERSLDEQLAFERGEDG